MNLNSIKRGFTKTNPEKGLLSLPGAARNEREKRRSSTVRVTGQYVSKPPHPVGLALGMLCYILSWVAVGIMVLGIFGVLKHEDVEYLPLACFFTGFLFIHGGALMAEAFQGKEAPYARKGIIIFWIGSVATLLLSFVL